MSHRLATSWVIVLALTACGKPPAVNENHAPEAPTVTLSPETATTNDALVADVSALEDPDGDDVTAIYKWTRDGIWLIEWSTDTVPAHTAKKGEVWGVEVTATDGELESASTSASTTIANLVPVASEVVVEPAAPHRGDDLHATSALTDGDDDSISGTWTWYVNDAVVDGANSETFVGTELVQGDEVRVEVTPFDGEVDGDTVSSDTIAVVNRLPTISSAAITPDPLHHGKSATCEVTGVSDADGDTIALSVRWTINGAAAGTGAALNGNAFVAGDTIACAATPNDGFDDGDEVLSADVVVSNTAPTIGSVAITPSSPLSTDTLTAGVLGAADAEGDAITLTYEWLVNNVPASSTSDKLGPTLHARGNSVTVRVTPTDSNGAAGSAVTSAPVSIGNALPRVNSADIAPSSPKETDVVSVVASTADDDGDTVSLAYSWTVNGVQVATTSTINGSKFSRGDSLAVNVTPNDGIGSGAPFTSGPVSVLNSVPRVNSAVISPIVPKEGDVVSVGVSSADDDGDTVALAYAWTVNGVQIASTATLDSTKFAHGDVIAVRVTPTDALGASGSPFTSATVTVGNALPRVTSAVISPTAPKEADTVSVGVTTADDDGDAVSAAYVWTVNGVQVATTPTIDGSNFARGDVIAVRVTPTDALGAIGSTVTSATVTVANTLPRVTSAEITPTSPKEADTLSVAGWTVDDDGDTVSAAVSWTVNGVPVATTPTINGSKFSRGNSVAVRITPNDGIGSGAPFTTASVTVANTPPLLTNLVLSPTAPGTNDIVIATPTKFDADGDPVSVSYAWTVNSAPTGVTADRINGNTAFAKHDVIRATATPSDGTDTGAPASASVTARNTPPTAPVIAITPASPLDDDDLFCDVIANGVDIDGDVIDYFGTEWTWDGNYYGSSADPVPAVDTFPGELWQCVVTPNDGEADGPAATDAVTVAPSCLSGSVKVTASPAGLVANWNGILAPTYSNLTAELWIRFHGTVSAYPYILTSYVNAGAGELWIAGVTAPTTNGSWHHLAQVFDAGASQTRLYLDGVVVQTGAATLARINAQGLWIAGPQSTGQDDHSCNCEIQGLRVSNRVVYTSTFTPSTAYGLDANTLLFVPMTDSVSGEARDLGPYNIPIIKKSTASVGLPGPYCY